MRISHTQPAHIDAVFAIINTVIAQRKARGNVVWDAIDRAALEADIAAGNHYCMWDGEEIVFIFSTTYDDAPIWKHREQGDAFYLHRAIRKPDYPTRGLFLRVIEWAKSHARERNLPKLRIDSWAENTPLVQYYVDNGFAIVGAESTGDDPALPKQHRNLQLTLLEMAVS